MATMQEHEGRECENKLVMLLDAYDKFDFIKVLLKNQVRAPRRPRRPSLHSTLRRTRPDGPSRAAHQQQRGAASPLHRAPLRNGFCIPCEARRPAAC